ncbi:hypothetical protein ES703_58132 [subsurface metagenome]
MKNLKKRLRPDHCELCQNKHNAKRIPIRLDYHHWNKKNPSRGLWLCNSCHVIAEFFDKPDAVVMLNYYDHLKYMVDVSNIDTISSS